MFFNFKRKKENKESSEIVLADSEEHLVIPVERVSLDEIHDQSILIEIKNHNILEHVDALIPGMIQTGNAAANAAAAANANGAVLYRAIIPSGTSLAKSQAVSGAFRGFYYGSDGIEGHANLVEETITTSNGVRINTLASAMAVASMVVGQYYMNKINNDLQKLDDAIEDMANFQNSEYKSKVFSLLQHVSSISKFQMEIIENDEARLLKTNQLEDLEKECTQLLGQAVFMIDGLMKKAVRDYNDYEEVTTEIQRWYEYQSILMTILYKIADLKYALYMGANSREQCADIISNFEIQVKGSQKKLSGWHEQMRKRFAIDAKHGRRKRQGIVGAVFKIPGMFNENLQFKELSAENAAMINSQSILHADFAHDTSELYSKDVKLYASEGKLYYLPEM